MPIPLCLCLSLLLAGLFLPGALRDNAIVAATEAAAQTANQIKVIRGYYTKHVIRDVNGAAGLSAGIAHQDDPSVIPLPATLVHDVSALLTGAQTSLALYSPFPFDNRAERPTDPFMTEAWEALSKDPNATFQQTETIDGSTVLRVAIGDHMTSEVCVPVTTRMLHRPRRTGNWEICAALLRCGAMSTLSLRAPRLCPVTS
ncbi:hypothetical protein [Pseudophaeobacter leonis]|uniref:hypothetical protein n=1 Tax=Pseudophaeobacter leonis TaxID=1144477 RepID=UPI001F4D3A65|nr:hypothetical protein [Pseudophaeobacter leonis]